MKWETFAGFRKPAYGIELNNAELSEALKERSEFTTNEWRAFGIGDLHLYHVIKSGSSYYRPFEIPEGFLPTARAPQPSEERSTKGDDVRLVQQMSGWL